MEKDSYASGMGYRTSCQYYRRSASAGWTKRKIGSGKYHFSVDIPTRNAAIISDEFLYEKASFPECHGATIVELKNGDLVASFFGGTKERNPDCCIWVCRKPKGAKEWTAPKLAADGVFTQRFAGCFSRHRFDLHSYSGCQRKTDCPPESLLESCTFSDTGRRFNSVLQNRTKCRRLDRLAGSFKRRWENLEQT